MECWPLQGRYTSFSVNLNWQFQNWIETVQKVVISVHTLRGKTRGKTSKARCWQHCHRAYSAVIPGVVSSSL